MSLSKSICMLALVALGTACRDRADDSRTINVTVMPPLTIEGISEGISANIPNLPRVDAGAVGTTTITSGEVEPTPAARAGAAPAAPAVAAAAEPDADGRDGGTRSEPSERYGIIEAPDLARNLGLQSATGSAGGTSATATAPPQGQAATAIPASAPESGGGVQLLPTRPDDQAARRGPPSAADPIPWTGNASAP